jgi:hypothetical protein
MNTRLSFILLIIVILVFSCKEKYAGEPLAIRNNSDSRIYYWYSYWKNENFTLYHYPDTILPEEKPVYLSSIAPHNSEGSGESDPNWKEVFEKLDGKKFSVYFFINNPENQSEWNLIRQNYNLYRKDVTYQELVNNNYIINYP